MRRDSFEIKARPDLRLLFGKLMKGIEWLLFPAACPSCGRTLDMNRTGFCPSCRKKLVIVKEPVCACCGKPVGDANEYCPECSRQNHVFSQNRSAFAYSGAAKPAMYRLKYRGMRWIAQVLAKEIVAQNREWFLWLRPKLLIPVPMNMEKERERGYNQAEVLARALSAELQAVCQIDAKVSKMVIRSRFTVPQKQLSVYVRRKNLKKAFKIDKNVVKLNGSFSDMGEAPFRSVLLVDDIFTTGATMDAVSELLLEAGIAKEVFCVTAMIGVSGN